MRLDEAFLITLFAGFIRTTALLLSSPLSGNSVPVMVRVFLGLAISMCIAPVIQPFVPVPETMGELVALAIREAGSGLLVGLVIQLLVGAVQMAGSILDLQIGIGSAQILNPAAGTMSTPLGTFKFWLAVVLLFILNAHQLMIKAMVASYQSHFDFTSTQSPIIDNVLQTFSSLMMVCVQIAAPVVAVTVLIDVSAGLINKAVPQTQPFLLSIPAKLAVGVAALALGLPMVAALVQRAVDLSFTGLARILGGA